MTRQWITSFVASGKELRDYLIDLHESVGGVVAEGVDCPPEPDPDNPCDPPDLPDPPQ